MENFQKTTKRGPKIVIGVCILALLGWGCWNIFVFPLLELFSPIIQWVEIPADRSWDARNEDTLTQIPPPAKVKIIEKRKEEYYGGSAAHGRWLYIEYDRQGLFIDDILDYYDQLLQSNHWVRQYMDGDEGKASYFRDKTCIFLGVIHPDLIGGHTYIVTIWQDYLSLPVSLIYPPYPILDFVSQFSETPLAICPEHL